MLNVACCMPHAPYCTSHAAYRASHGACWNSFHDLNKIAFLTNRRVREYNAILDALVAKTDSSVDMHAISTACLLHTPDGIHFQQPLYLLVATQILTRFGELSEGGG